MGLLSKPQNHSGDVVGSFNNKQIFGHDMWLIFADQPSRRKRAYLLKILKAMPIHLDSLIFAFYKKDGGKIFLYLGGYGN